MIGAARTDSTLSQKTDVVVVGGGLAGLMATARIAQAGRSVQLFEQAGRIGGRATTDDLKGVHFNRGPHALYAHGAAWRLLTQMQVSIAGRFPNPGRPMVVLGDKSFRLPASLGPLVVSRLLSPVEKARLARLFMTLKRIDTRQLDRMPLRHVDRAIRRRLVLWHCCWRRWFGSAPTSTMLTGCRPAPRSTNCG